MFKVSIIETYGRTATFVVINVLNDPHGFYLLNYTRTTKISQLSYIIILKKLTHNIGTEITIYKYLHKITRFKILYSHKPMHYNGTEINTNIQFQYLRAHNKMMDVTQ
jgi:hypothetical protein